MSHDKQTGDERKNLEGTYTESNDEGPEERTVHGQYTETADFAGPEKETAGSYTDTDDEAEVSTAEEQGDYTESDRP
ncbi:MAG: hypothetical protein ABI130_04220 [Leifsonia sp.]|jgi:hypothetical protein|nr:hypothetical protein [Leifsonia sp.]